MWIHIQVPYWLHWSSSLFLCQYHADFIAIALKYSLKVGIVIPPALLYLFSTALAILSLFFPNEL
jgi:hypothetical protein